jgi:hypothetical protein
LENRAGETQKFVEQQRRKDVHGYFLVLSYSARRFFKNVRRVALNFG